jgi:hypothetical protein
MYLNQNIHFFEKDFISLIRQGYRKSYDYVILGAVISLFQEQEKEILFQYLKESKYLFIREVPRYGNIVDVYIETFERIKPPWNNYTETRIKEILKEFRYEILSVEHEYDIYIYAKS